MPELSLGVLGTSQKENEQRLPIHPAHLERLPPALRPRIMLERGYGAHFGVTDADLEPLVGGLLPAEKVIAECDVVLLPKPSAAELTGFREGQVLWGWPHCVQDEAITQVAIDRRLTLIAWESMNRWHPDGSFADHVFAANNELAGYCSVLHALALIGTTSQYGAPLRAAVISYGSTGRGAVTALTALGIRDVTVLTQRNPGAVTVPEYAVVRHFERAADDPARAVAVDGEVPRPMAEYLAGYDVVVNCVLQDTDAPLLFVAEGELAALRPGTLVVDVSCDEGMGFSWARPTSFEEPMFTVGPNVRYYAVDHSPSYLWNSATWEISEALLPYLEPVMAGPRAWDADETVRRAIEIRDGVVQNPKILSFQHRAAEYPHAKDPA